MEIHINSAEHVKIEKMIMCFLAKKLSRVWIRGNQIVRSIMIRMKKPHLTGFNKGR